MRSLRNTPAGRVAYCGMLTALAMIFSYVESFIPLNFGIPGIKLGLANLVVLTGLYYLKPGEVFMISICRILLTGFLFGSGMSIVYSLAGGLLSFLAMLVLVKRQLLSRIGVSAVGAVMHNFGQILAACAILHSFALIYYLPALIVSGVVTGVLMGILSGYVAHVLR